MTSSYLLSNTDLQFVNAPGQDFTFYLAFLNPVAFTTRWADLNLDSQGNWSSPPNIDTLATHDCPYKPVANLGGNRIGFVGEPLYFDGGRSCQRHDLPVVSYKWVITGQGKVTPYANNSQVSVVWTTPGLYTIALTVTDRYGSSTTGTRQVMVYLDRSHALPGVLSISGLSGSLANGGWQCQVQTINSQVSLLPPDRVPVGTYQPLVIMCETRYELVPGYWINETIGPNGDFHAGYTYQDPRILFDGYVQSGTAHQDIDKDTLSFTCVGVQFILQEVQAHMVGYWNTSYKNTTSLNSTPNGTGYLVSGLMTSDIIFSILLSHANIGAFHDIHLWNTTITTNPYQKGNKTAFWFVEYSTLGLTEGSLWQNLQDLTVNEWADVYCEHDGSIRVGPSPNLRGQDYWIQPTLLGNTTASALINFVQDLGYNVGKDITQMANNLPILPAQPMPIQFVHQAQNGTLAYHLIAGGGSNGQLGPPVVCAFADSPVYDSSTTPPANLNPMTFYTWPQDLAVYPFSYDVTENYTARASLVKLIGTLFGHSSQITSWYPQNAFSVAGDGITTLVNTTLPAGQWIVNESHVVGDITNYQNAVLVLNFMWEMARREYYTHFINYNVNVSLGMFTACALGDIVSVTRQQNLLGPNWLGKLFYVNQIDYNVDFTARTWFTTIGLTEITATELGPPVPPPAKVPKFS